MNETSTMNFEGIEAETFKWMNRARTDPSTIIEELTQIGLNTQGSIYTNPKTLERTELREVILNQVRD